MQLLIIAAMLLAQATPMPGRLNSPAPAATLSPDWKKASFGADEYAHYTRSEKDGTVSAIVATRKVCDCQPAVMTSMLYLGLVQRVRDVTIARYKSTICGHSTERLIATGIASADPTTQNLEVIFFRVEPALYTLMYTFRSAAPMPDAEKALAALCP